MGTASLHANAKSPFFPGFKVYRNVKDYGAVGNGIADDTAAINKAISDGGSCGEGCPSSSVRPMLIYFPSGTYRVTAPIVPYYFTSLVGDYNNKPQLVADANFQGVAVIDGDPYIPGEVNPDGTGVNWWTNQNNFFRSVRNFVIRTTNMPATTFGTGIHWQVGQATSLINIDFFVSSAAGTKHQGIFMENGSGGFMSDITIDGGAFGMWVSNQQFTIRRVTITNALWNWGFTWQDIQIVGCQVGFDINTGGLTLATQSAGSLLIVDSIIEGTGIGVRLSSTQLKSLAGSVILNNVQMQATRTANIQDGAGTVERASDTTYGLWIQGNVYSGARRHIYNRGVFPGAPARPKALLDPNTKMFYQKSRPQYNTYLPSRALGGAKGDGVTDDSTAINNFIAAHAGCGILYFDAGTYLVKKTIFVPAGTIIVGEMFSVIMGSGTAFQNQGSPTPVLRVGNKGDVGAVEISDLVITTTGGSQGAVGVEWNIKGKNPGDAGMWDVHVRLGGAIGTGVQASTCPTSSQNLAACATAFLGFHITNTGSGYFENLWVWNADHDLDDPAQTRINAFSARGILVESASGPVWLIGTASEHHVIYQYAFYNTENVYAGLIQTETPYFQPTPNPPAPFSTSLTYGDPAGARQDAWGLVITSSANIFIYGAGLYSFFQTYGQACVDAVNCQNDIALIDTASSAIYIFQLTTTGVVNMITQLPVLPLALAADNKNGFCSTVSYYESPSRIDPRVSALGAQCYGLGHIHGASGATLWAASHLSQHIIYGYVQIGTDGGVSLELDYVFELEGILAMKAQAPDLKVMLGGANISRTGRTPPLMIYFSRRLGFWC
ncbi:glycoside hydrolase family 55 protein [Mycena olivaceomarginata]|nr:glycoside hydrolase family 55 protein [Mycena olivaceomarginata]